MSVIMASSQGNQTKYKLQNKMHKKLALEYNSGLKERPQIRSFPCKKPLGSHQNCN